MDIIYIYIYYTINTYKYIYIYLGLKNIINKNVIPILMVEKYIVVRVQLN